MRTSDDITSEILKFKESFDDILCGKLLTEFNELYKKGVTLSVSGGVDSMVMLVSFLVFQKKYGIKFNVINFEHGLRGEASILDSFLVSEFCNKFEIECKTISLDVLKHAEEESMGIEQAARDLRHKYYADIWKNERKYVLLAHNLNDLTESVLMHIFRGSGVKGLLGMSYQDGYIIRPLIYTTRETIEHYAKIIELPFRNDDSNSDDCYTRNFLRNKVIPLIKTRVMNLDTSILKLSKNMRSIYGILDKYAEKVLIVDKDAVLIDVKKLSEYEDFAGDIIKIALNKLKSDIDFTSSNIEQICQLKYKNNGKQINLPHGIIALKAYDYIKLYEYKPVDNYSEDFQVGKFERKDDFIKFLEVHNVTDYKDGIYVDLDKIPKGSVIRRRKQDDIFTNFAGYTMSLSDYLTKKKIPHDERDKLYVVAYDNVISIVIGIEQSITVKITDSTKRIVKVIIEKKE